MSIIRHLLSLFDFQHHKIQDSTLIVGGTAAAAGGKVAEAAGPTGQWLATHGIGVLTWIEIIQIIGAIGVLVATANILVRAIISPRKTA